MTLEFYLEYNIHKFVGFQPTYYTSVTHFHRLLVLFVRFVSAFSVTPYDYTFCISCVFICVLLFLVSSFPPSILCCRSLSLQEPQGILFIYSLLGNQSCRNHTLPTLWHSQNPPVPCFVSSFPQTLRPPTSITGGICTAKGRWPSGAHQSPIKHTEVAHMEFCWVEPVTENEQKSRRCWFVLWQRPPCLIRPQSLHSVWHHPNTAYGNEACIWLQLGEIWPPLHKSVQRQHWLWGRVVNQSQ